MNRFLLALVICLTGILPIAAQELPMVVPVFNSPDASEIETFQSVQDSFSADFVGKVSVKVESAGQFSVGTYQSGGSFSQWKVVVYEFGKEALKQLDRQAFINDLKKDLKAEVVSENFALLDGGTAYEIISDKDPAREMTRIVSTEDRIFRVSVKLSLFKLQPDESKLAFQNEADRFFGSFRTGFEVTEFEPKSEGGPTLIGAQMTAASGPFGWSVFSFDGGRFLAALPVQPTEEIEPINNELIKTSLYSYSSEAENQVYSFGFVDFGFDFGEDVDPKGFFDSWENGILESLPDARITRRDFEFKGHKARRVIIESEVLRMEAIVLYIEGRMVQMVVASAAQMDEAALLENATQTTAYFDSFEYVRRIESYRPNILARENDAEPTLFKSEKYGFEIMLPAGWASVDEDTIINQARKSAENDSGINNTGKTNLETSIAKTEVLFMVMKNFLPKPGAGVLNCVVEKLLNPRTSTKTIANTSYRGYLKNFGYTAVAAPVYVKLNGIGFYMFKMKKERDGVELTQWIYQKKVKGNILQFAVTENDSVLLAEMQQALETLRFIEN